MPQIRVFLYYALDALQCISTI